MKKIFDKKKVLITGHTGFKGSWLTAWLVSMGAEVTGLSISVPTSPSMFDLLNLPEKITDLRCDIKDLGRFRQSIIDMKPDYIFHMAAQSLVRQSYSDPLNTFSTNALGTINLLESLKAVSHPVNVVIITSDKVYDNVEWHWGYREIDRIGGKDPYSASKGMAELAIRSYIDSYFGASNHNVRIAIARAGNVIGGGDWSADRIVPDSIKSWVKREKVVLRSPKATRPWQHVLEPLSGYLTLAQRLNSNRDLHGQAYNFGPFSNLNYSVESLINAMASIWGDAQWQISRSDPSVPEAGLLKLNCDKALAELDWSPTLNFDETVQMTVDWYKNYYLCKADDVIYFTYDQIQTYQKLAESRGRFWSID